MPQSRKSQISLSATPYYHCISRCVRKAFLCGVDPKSGKSYEHRREWVENKLLFLSDVFAIKICAYAVMSNHLHTVLFVDEREAKNWSDEEALTRWHRLFKGTPLSQRYLNDQNLNQVDAESVKQLAQVYKERLCSLSWFMRVLNEGIARQANKEDECTGRFWEGRFKSQALLDEAALLTCMAYVDLNPVRAGMSDRPDNSEFTSIKLRSKEAKKGTQPKSLLPFVGEHGKEFISGIRFSLEDYFKLIFKTASSKNSDTTDLVNTTNSILGKLNITMNNWTRMCFHFTQLFHGPVGCVQSLCAFHKACNHKRRSNLGVCQRMFA